MTQALLAARSPLEVLVPGAAPELRDARLLAWLLEPEGEHGLGRQVLVRVATCLTGYGRQELSRLLVSAAPPPVEVELRLRGTRVELLIGCGPRELLLAWRAAARAEDVDLASQATPARDVVGVGPDGGAFPPDLPVLAWGELLGALEGAERTCQQEPWRGLLIAFRDRLRALLGLETQAPPPPPPAPVPAPAPVAVAPPAAPAPPPVAAPLAPPGTRRVARPAPGSSAPLGPTALASKLLGEVPALAQFVPGLTPPALRPQDVSEGTMIQGPDRRRTYLIHRLLEEGSQARLFEVMVQGQASFPGYEEEVGIAAILVPHQGSDLAARLGPALARPDPLLIRLLAHEQGSASFLLLERLAPHPWGAFGVVDPITAVHTFVNLLEALPSAHQRLDRILCAINPDNLRLRYGGGAPPEGADYLTRLTTGAWEPVLVGLESSVAGGSTPPLVAGDPLFLPPESLPRGGGPGRFSRKTDVYALTLTFYQLLTGDQPYGRTDLHQREGEAWLAELLALKEKGISPVNGMLLHGRFEPPVAEALLEIFRGGLAPDSTQRKSAEDLLALCRARLGLVERRPAIAPDAYVYDDTPGLHLQQTKLPQTDLRQIYGQG